MRTDRNGRHSAASGGRTLASAPPLGGENDGSARIRLVRAAQTRN